MLTRRLAVVGSPEHAVMCSAAGTVPLGRILYPDLFRRRAAHAIAAAAARARRRHDDDDQVPDVAPAVRPSV